MLRIDDFIIEVGRKCNLNCEHCLRGESQNLTIPFEIAKKAIDLVDEISCITFTGGEPTLYGQEIADIIHYIISSRKPVSCFYIASNGISYSPVLMNALIELFAYVQEPELSVFDISTDRYHQESYRELYDKDLRFDPRYDAFSFLAKRGDLPEYAVIMEGRAKEYCYSDRMPKYSKTFRFEIEDLDGKDYYTAEMLYVTAKGQLSPDCDFAYTTFDALGLPDINSVNSQSDLLYGLLTYNRKIESLQTAKISV